MNVAPPNGDSPADDLVVWQRPDSFPPSGEGYGWMDRKGTRHAVDSVEDLAKAIRQDGENRIRLVWTPDFPFCRVPEEIPELAGTLSEARKRWSREEWADACYRLRNFGIAVALLLGYMAFHGWRVLSEREKASGLNLGFWESLGFVTKALASSTSVGFALLAFLVFAFIPWYQARKRLSEVNLTGGNPAGLVPLIRFETWLDAQKAPMTRAILFILGAVFAVQVFHDRSLMMFRDSVLEAGLAKDAYRSGDTLRLFTAPLLHGGFIHFAMNALALVYLGKRVEVFARWPHVPTVFFFSALVGGEFSARLVDATSVGASGGLMGWLGFLLVFESLHTPLVPRSAKRRLVGGLITTALIGLIGYRFIDNAAHFGGLLAGMAYAAIVFPKSGSVMRPDMNLTDRVFGAGAFLLLGLSALAAILRMVS